MLHLLKITMLANPLDKGLADDIECEKINLASNINEVSQFFEKKYEWDILASKSVWAFGPTKFGPNALLDDTLPSETDKSLLS